MADHVIIGSGINALVAAALLSRKGDKVLVLEREARIGGCMVSDAATLPGFVHDVMATTFVLFLTSPAHAALAGDLARHGLEFCHSRHPTGVLRPDGTALVLTMDRAANVAAFNSLAAGDGDRHAADVGAIEADAPFLFGLLGGDLWSWGTARMVAAQVWRRGVRGMAAWFGAALAPARGWLETGYRSELVQALWAPWVLHCGLTPESAYGARMGQVVAFALEAAGAPVVKGGAAAAVAAFRALIEENGGAFRTGVDVDRIIVEAGAVVAVETAQGERIGATSVLASVTPGQLQGRLLRDVAVPAEKQAGAAWRHGRGNFQLHYALNGPVDWHTDGLADVALIHIADGIDAVSASANQAERGLLPSIPTLCVGQPHRLDPSRCPDGKAILWIQVPDAPRVIKGDAARKIITGPVWTEATREAFADRIEDILVQHIPGFSANVLARRAYSPADLAAMNMNLVGGDPYGGACSVDQFFLWRPSATGSPVKGLRQIGASVHPGPGLGGGSGYLAAKALGA